MASLKRLGFFWGEEKITLVDFEKNSPVQVVVSPLGLKSTTPSPFASNLTEEIQITVLLKKMLEDNKIKDGAFYVSLPMKEIILRSFIIPFVKQEDLLNAIKYEAKRYIPFDIQDLSFVFHTIPFTEDKNKRLQVIFYAARREVLTRYERIFEQVNMKLSYSEPYIVSLSKALIFRKEIDPVDHLAFLILEKNLGRICFIVKGIPQFIREFPISSLAPSSESVNDPQEVMNSKIVNEVGNSFDFYTRQFNVDRVEKLLVSTDFVQKDLTSALEAELKIRIQEFSPVISTSFGQSNDLDAIYAMGACVPAPIDSLAKFNFVQDKAPKPKMDIEVLGILNPYKELLFTFGLCVIFLIGLNVFFQIQIKMEDNKYKQFVAKEGALAYEDSASIQAETQQNIDKLNQYKSIRTKSDISTIIFKIASHLQKGTRLDQFKITYLDSDANQQHVNIDIQGVVINGGFNDQIGVVNQLFSDFKNDKTLSQFITGVNLVSLNRSLNNNGQSTTFEIHFS